ncbi:MAG: SHOCT domain-containing protein [Haloarculaceae archaeon]
MSSSSRLDLTTVLLVVLVALLVLPVLVMGLGFGGMMGYGWMMGGATGGSGWWPFVGMLVPLVLLLVLVAVGYLVVRRLLEDTRNRDPPMEELRTAYARGDLTDEEFETRRRKLEEAE